MKNILLSGLLISTCFSVLAQAPKKATIEATKGSTPVVNEKFKQDRDAILSLQGCYKVSFNFAETFSPDTGYKYHERHRSEGVECVLLLEDSERKIVFQHLLIINDTMIVKHWREDWVYENTDLLGYYKDNQWIKSTLKSEQVKGQWAQKVYQVDDSPRYEANGTWIHIDGQHYWESTCDAPLPRREHTTRDDYNVMRRHSRIALTQTGWLLEQDNEKIIRKDGVDKLLVWEKGIEKFSRGSYNCQPALNYWEKNKKFWANVRTAWTEVYSKYPAVKLEKRVDTKLLYERLFKLADDKTASKEVADISKVLEAYLKS